MPTKRVAVRTAASPAPTKRAAARPAPVDDDDDAVPAPRQMKSAASAGGLRVKGGLAEAKRQYESNATYAQSFKPDEAGSVVKFLEDENYAGYKRHWIKRADENGRPTNRPYTCMRSFTGDNGKPRDCPLCEIGDRPQAVSSFNIAVLTEDGTISLKSWDMGVKVFNLAMNYANNAKVGPLSRGFFFVTRTGKDQQTQYNMIPIKATALQEDYDVPVPSEDALKAIDVYTPDVVQVTPMKELREIAEELSDEYE